MNSSFLKLGIQDYVKGFVMAVVSALITGVYSALTTVPMHIDFKQIGTVGLTAGLAYLIKNVFTNSDGQILTKEQPK
jgi:hypothetical protein